MHITTLIFHRYDNEWYNLPKRSKVLLQIMMMRCMKPHSLSAGGMTDINFYNFGVVFTIFFLTKVKIFLKIFDY